MKQLPAYFLLRKESNYILIALYILIVVVLASATIVEKLYGTQFVGSHIYGSWWFAVVWAVLAVTAIAYICRQKLQRRPVVFTIHVGLLTILLGAITTHIFGLQGDVHVRKGDPTNTYVDKADGKTYNLPFTVELNTFVVEYYPGTTSPMDYVSSISFAEEGDAETSQVSMNHVATFRGYRFYQAGYDEDGEGTHFALSYDPWGIGISYCGYGLLFLSLILTLVLPNEGFRTALRRVAKGGLATTIALLFVPLAANADVAPKTLPAQQAEELCNLYAYHNGRICPLQTVATNLTVKLYGKSTYRGMTSAQVLAGFLFFPTDWIEEPIIKVSGEVASRLNKEGKYLSYNDFILYGNYRLQQEIDDIRAGREVSGSRSIEEADEKMNLVRMLLSGQIVRLFPYRHETPQGEVLIRWFSGDDPKPRDMPDDQRMFMRRAYDLIGEYAFKKEYDDMSLFISKIRRYQEKTAGDALPSETRFKAEKLYASLSLTRPLAMSLATIGIVLFVLFVVRWAREQGIPRALMATLTAIIVAVAVYLLFVFCLRWYVAGHIPISNGYETMQFLALVTLVLTLMLRRFVLVVPFGYLVAGLAMMVSMFGESNPQITNLMPVLTSPLLSMHDCTVMVAYSLTAFMFFTAIASFFLREREESLASLSRAILYPAITLLAIGIFVGAIWANQSWGRYWGWDPKEVWALITLLVYALPMHPSLVPSLSRPRRLLLYLFFAFVTVLMTYFGVNFLLGGMHAYANS